MEDEVDGQKEEQREEDEEEEVIGDVEETQQWDTTDDTCMDGVSADPNLSQCSVMLSEQRKTVKGRWQQKKAH